MFRILIMLWMFCLALLCATSVEFDGVLQGRAWPPISCRCGLGAG